MRELGREEVMGGREGEKEREKEGQREIAPFTHKEARKLKTS